MKNNRKPHGCKYDGMITVNVNNRHDGAKTLTFRNVNFVSSTANNVSIYSPGKFYPPYAAQEKWSAPHT